MEFGLSLTGHVPLRDEAELAALAEAQGFDYVWAWDNQVLGQDAYVILGSVAERTSRVKLGTCVTNPVTRDHTVLASLFATLNNHTGGRMICGIGRGDSAVRMRNDRPSTLATLREASETIRELAAGRPVTIAGDDVRLGWSDGHEVPIYLAAYGPKALTLAGAFADGVILQLGDPEVIEWFLGFVHRGAEAAGRDPAEIQVQCAAPLVIDDDLAAARDLVRWFPAAVGNHVADLLKRQDPSTVPAGLFEYLQGRTSYDYRDHTRPGADHADYVTDDIVDRFCVIGSAEACAERVRDLERVGVTELNVYAKVPDPTGLVTAVGEQLMPKVHDGSSSGLGGARLCR